MILGWRHGNSAGLYVLVDSLFPWPSLHHGRNALRNWCTVQNRRREQLGDEGPWRTSVGLTTAVCEYGDIRLRVWPVLKARDPSPRPWTGRDLLWRGVLGELRSYVSSDLKCCAQIQWMPGGSVVQRSETVFSLRGIQGFWGWRKGESEPSEKIKRSLRRMSANAVIGARINGAQRLYHAS